MWQETFTNVSQLAAYKTLEQIVETKQFFIFAGSLFKDEKLTKYMQPLISKRK